MTVPLSVSHYDEDMTKIIMLFVGLKLLLRLSHWSANVSRFTPKRICREKVENKNAEEAEVLIGQNNLGERLEVDPEVREGSVVVLKAST